MKLSGQLIVVKSLFCYFIFSVVLAGCGEARIPPTFKSFDPVDLNDKFASGDYTGKIENFLVIMDTSSTMNKRYLYEVYESTTTPTLFEVEKEIVKRLNLTIPEMKLNAGIRTFGFGSCQSWGFSQERLKIGPYDKKSFDDALRAIECAGGGSPMEYAVELAGSDLESFEGKTGLIIISDGVMDNEPPISVVELKKQYGKRLCVHTISLGKNPSNRLAMRRLSALSGCGYTTTAEEVAAGSGMAEFVEKVFLKENRQVPR